MKIKKPIITLSIILLFSNQAFGDVYKCNVDGKVRFSDVPCKGNGEKVDIKPVTGTNDSDPNFNQSQLVKFNKLISLGRIERGMNTKMVVRAWGSPTKINTSVGSYGKHEQWIYRHNNGLTDYVYFENGTVSSMQLAH